MNKGFSLLEIIIGLSVISLTIVFAARSMCMNIALLKRSDNVMRDLLEAANAVERTKPVPFSSLMSSGLLTVSDYDLNNKIITSRKNKECIYTIRSKY